CGRLRLPRGGADGIPNTNRSRKVIIMIDSEKSKSKAFNRRDTLKLSGLALGGLALGGMAGGPGARKAQAACDHAPYSVDCPSGYSPDQYSFFQNLPEIDLLQTPLDDEEIRITFMG